VTLRPAEGDREERLRARLNLNALLPVLSLVEPPPARAVVQFAVDEELAAHLVLDGERARVGRGMHRSPTVTLRFADARALNRFFAGRPSPASLPSVSGWRHPLVLASVARLLGRLRILDPRAACKTPSERAARVRLVLAFITRALAELARAGHHGMRALVDDSPDRVYQWTVAERGIGGFLRVCRGRARAGSDVYIHRRPFVHFVFPTVEAAYRVFTATGSQMDAVARGLVRTEGSPEHARAISRMMQEIDRLLGEA